MKSKLVKSFKTVFKFLVIWAARIIFSFFVGSYVISAFTQGGPLSLQLLKYFFLQSAEYDGSLINQELLEHCANLALTHKYSVVISCHQYACFLGAGWKLQWFQTLDSSGFVEVISGALAVIRRSAVLLEFKDWLRFWLVILYPIMPWSVLYTDDSLYYGLAYKSQARNAFWTCLKVLAGYEVDDYSKKVCYYFVTSILVKLAELLPCI